MPSAQEIVTYHRSFISKYYFENFQPLSDAERRKRNAAEIEEIRQRNPDAFEKARQSLAFMLKVPYSAGYYIPAARGDQGGPSSPRWVSGTPSDAQVGECMAPLNPSQSKITSPETGFASLPLVDFSYKAYINGEQLYETRVFQKMDQFFDDYATPFEKGFSKLCLSSKGNFTPILNNSYEVVGHLGTLYGGLQGQTTWDAAFVVPSKFVHGTDLDYAMKKGIPVFVRSRAGTPDGWDLMQAYTSEDKIEVRTTVDGEVTDYKLSGAGALIEPWYSPADFIFVGEVLVNLGTKLGAKVTKTLLRRATMKMEARAVMEGATKKLAREAEEAEAKAASRAGGEAGEGGGRGTGGGGAGGGGGGGAANGARRALSESQLNAFPHIRFAGRVVSRKEMQALVRKVIRERPYLSKIAAAGKSAKAGADEVMQLLREWANATGKTFMKVTDGTVKRLGSMGGGGWAIDSLTGKEILILDEALFKAPDKFVNEILHELSYEATRELQGVPKLAEGAMINANDWLENALEHGEKALSFLD